MNFFINDMNIKLLHKIIARVSMLIKIWQVVRHAKMLLYVLVR